MLPDKNFLLEEFKAARTRIDKEIDQMNNLEIVYITLFFAINAALFQFKVQDQLVFLLCSALFLAIAIYGRQRLRAHSKVIIIHESYIKYVIEHYQHKRLTNFQPDRTLGLMTYYDKHKGWVENLHDPNNIRGSLSQAREYLWYAIGFFSIVYLILSVCKPEMLASLYREKSKCTLERSCPPPAKSSLTPAQQSSL